MERIHTYEMGTETDLPCIYILHSLPLDSTYLQRSLSDIQVDRKVVCIDLPNHGKSIDVDLATLDFELMADYLHEFQQSQNHDKVVVYGHGLGGFVAQYYASKYEKSLKALILSNTAPNFKYRNELAWNIRERFASSTRKALDSYFGKTDDKSILARFTQSFAVYFFPTNHEEAKKIMDDAARISTETYVHLSVNVIPKFSVREKIRNITLPTLLITGDEDVWPSSAMLYIQNDISSSKLLKIQGGHFSMLENPSSYWQHVFSWLGSIGS